MSFLSKIVLGGKFNRKGMMNKDEAEGTAGVMEFEAVVEVTMASMLFAILQVEKEKKVMAVGQQKKKANKN